MNYNEKRLYYFICIFFRRGTIFPYLGIMIVFLITIATDPIRSSSPNLKFIPEENPPLVCLISFCLLEECLSVQRVERPAKRATGDPSLPG